MLHHQTFTPDASRHWGVVPASMDFAGNHFMEMTGAGLRSYCPVCLEGKNTIKEGGATGTT
jgi:hypothetical protein